MTQLSGLNSWVLIPFYSDPVSGSHTNDVEGFRSYLERLKNHTDLNIAIVDDGSGLRVSEWETIADLMVQNPSNLGKAEAVRRGLRTLLSDPEFDANYILQMDADRDQSFIDLHFVLDPLMEITGEDSGKAALAVGERYSGELISPINPDSVAYRQSVLILFGLLAKRMGINLKDWQSGTRGYSMEYANRFLKRSVSSRYGLEAEQVVVSYIEQAKVIGVPLALSRPRESSTSANKFIQNLEAIMSHKKSLENKGQVDLLTVVEDILVAMREGRDLFEIGLGPLGEDVVMTFEMIEGSYTAKLPDAFRRGIFPLIEEPFLIKKELGG